uniref:Uncharacterized protein n=1 Tax=Meloidogyne enterolobii TaxID=390850 RepID=A0A6V7W463_MELEN|nr:unnamed protein product [Meloidogyne enterolobii]
MAYYSPASNKSFPPQNLAASSSSISASNSPGRQRLPVVVKEKSPQKKTPTRSRGQAQRRVAALSPGDASSSEALASTIASVASGGGSLEEFEKFSAATSLGSSSNSSPSSLYTNSLNVHPGPSTFSEQLSASQNIIQPPSSSKRRKNCSSSSALNSTQSHQKINQLLLSDSPNASLGTLVERNKRIGPLSASQYQHIQEVQQQQCRIHVQNPPQTHGDFPVTGTKIQVVHMQPSPAAAASSLTGACESPQQPQFSHQQQHYLGIGSMLPPPRSQQNELMISNHYQPNQHPPHHHSLPSTPFSSTGLDFCGSNVGGSGGVLSAEMMLSSSAAATPSPAGTIASSPAASVMPPASGGCIGGPSSVHGIQKIQQKHRTSFQHQKPILDNGGGPMSVGCNSSYSYPPPSPHWVSQQQSYSSAMSAQASPQPPQSILQRKIEDSGGSVGSSYVASSMPAASPYSQQQQIRQNHHQQYSPMSVPIHSGEASAVPSPQMSHRFHQNTPQQHLQSSPPQILGGGPHLQHQTQSAGLQPQTLVGGQNLNQQTFFATQQTSLPGQQQLQPIYHKKLQGRVQFHNQTHQQPQQLPLHYLQTPPQQQLLSQQQHYHHTSPIERPTAPLPTQQNMHPPPSPMFPSIKQQQHNANIGNHHVSNIPQNQSIYLSQQQQPPQTYLKQQQQIIQNQPFQQQPLVLSPPPPPYIANAYPSQQPPPQTMRMFPAATSTPFVCPLTPTGQMNIAGCSPSSQLLPPMPQPARAQLSRAHLLTRHSRELKCHKYAIKLYHLQRTTKALVYKNGALADELTRLQQQIQTVTEERRVLAKRLQHHERNRIRRLQTHFKKAAAAASAAAEAAEKKNEEETGGTTTSTTNCKKLVICTLLNSSKQKKHSAQLNCKESHTDKVSL